MLKIALDLDNTAVNVGPGWHSMCQSWADTLALPVDRIITTGERLWMTHGLTYSPEKHLMALEPPKEDFDALDAAMDIFYQWLTDGHALYPDTDPFLRWIGSCKSISDLCICTLGEPMFQSRKAATLAMPAAKFAGIIVTNTTGRKARHLVSKHGRSQHIVLVDDNDGEHEAAMTHQNIIRVQIVRAGMKMGRHAQHYIESLDDLPDLLPLLLAH